MPNKLRSAEDAVKQERGRLLQAHPRTVELLRRLGELRGELNQVTSDLYVIERAGGLSKSADGWYTTATMMNDRPPPDPALAARLDQLLVDPAAELSE